MIWSAFFMIVIVDVDSGWGECNIATGSEIHAQISPLIHILFCLSLIISSSLL